MRVRATGPNAQGSIWGRRSHGTRLPLRAPPQARVAGLPTVTRVRVSSHALQCLTERLTDSLRQPCCASRLHKSRRNDACVTTMIWECCAASWFIRTAASCTRAASAEDGYLRLMVKSSVRTPTATAQAASGKRILPRLGEVSSSSRSSGDMTMSFSGARRCAESTARATSLHSTTPAELARCATSLGTHSSWRMPASSYALRQT
ncbi:MAG: hypothetical protein RL033_311 [Pseudomonadota bacterium]